MSEKYWFQCPECKASGSIDRDQAEGRVSIVCECGMHKTGRVKPLIFDTLVVSLYLMPTFEEVVDERAGEGLWGDNLGALLREAPP